MQVGLGTLITNNTLLSFILPLQMNSPALVDT